MSIITRYLLRSFLGPLLLCFVCFNALFIIFDLFGQVSKFIDIRAGAPAVLKYYGGMLSMFSHWFIPASCLLATLYTMWQLSRHSELTALRASGISFTSLTMPFVGVALCATAVTFLMLEVVAPVAGVWSDQFKENTIVSGGTNRHARRNFDYIDPATSHNWFFAQADLSSIRRMSKPSGRVVVKRTNDDGSFWMLRTDRAEYLDGVWWFWNPREFNYVIDSHGGGAPEDEAFVDDPDLPVPVYELTADPRDIVMEQRAEELVSARDQRRLLALHESHAAKAEKWYEYYYRLTAPWACVVITIFAIPAGISTGRQSMIKGVILALAAFFGFYALTLAMKFMGYHNIIPPLPAALFPSLVFLGVGVVSFRRLV